MKSMEQSLEADLFPYDTAMLADGRMLQRTADETEGGKEETVQSICTQE